jgi:hypothetical protein
MKTITFFSTVPGLAETLPIISAKDLNLNWVKRARQDYIDTAKKQLGSLHLYRCPGIFDLFTTGYIIPMWHDIVISTNGDERNFQFTVPSPDINELMPGNKEVIGKQETGIGTLMPTRPWACQSLLKINTPWHVVAPRGVKFLMIPIAYPDTFEFESCTGILDPGQSSEINVQAYWNIKRGEHYLKAGTPLAHLIPLTTEEFKLECRDMSAGDNLWIEKLKFLKNFTFKLRRNLIKDAYLKHFGK